MSSNLLIIVPTLQAGGAEAMVSKLTYALAKEYNVHVCIFDHDAGADFDVAGTIHDLKVGGGTGKLDKILKAVKRYGKVKRLKRELNVVASLSFLEGPNLINILTKGKENIVVSIRGDLARTRWYKTFKWSVIRKMILSIYNRAEHIVVNSKGMSNDIQERFGIRKDLIRVIHNFFDLDFIAKRSAQPLDEEEAALFDTNIFVNVGRLTQAKGQWHLIRSFSSVAQYMPESRLVLVGDGEYRKQLISLSEDLGLRTGVRNDMQRPMANAQVCFLGYESNIYKYLAKADVFVFPSITEGFPNALIEGMICSLPVLSADCPSGPREILSPVSKVDAYATTAEEAAFGVLLPSFSGEWLGAEHSLTDKEVIWADTMKDVMADAGKRLELGRRAEQRGRVYAKDSIIDEWVHLIEG